jgi:hypothetical protein
MCSSLISGMVNRGRFETTCAAALLLFSEPGVALVDPGVALPPTLPDPGVAVPASPTTSCTLFVRGVLGSTTNVESKNAYSFL